VKILAVYNIKGGVGKTATAVNLGHLASRDGMRTLVWDLDPQAAATFYFRVRPEVSGGLKQLLRRRRNVTIAIRGTDFERLDLLPADFSYRNLDLALDRSRKPKRRIERLLRPLEAAYDCVVLDCAPGISLVSESVFTAADALLVPTVPTPLSLRTLRLLREHLAKRGARRRPELLPFLCMVDVRKSLHREFRDRLLDDDGFLRTWIPYSSVVEQMGVRRAPLTSFAKSSLPACAYEQLWNEVRQKIGLAQPAEALLRSAP
jgi:cellulose biosynthesis protein BcsQ